jgi:hypothetical protein
MHFSRTGFSLLLLTFLFIEQKSNRLKPVLLNPHRGNFEILFQLGGAQ